MPGCADSTKTHSHCYSLSIQTKLEYTYPVQYRRHRF
jgi:hypothetical protein